MGTPNHPGFLIKSDSAHTVFSDWFCTVPENPDIGFRWNILRGSTTKQDHPTAGIRFISLLVPGSSQVNKKKKERERGKGWGLKLSDFYDLKRNYWGRKVTMQKNGKHSHKNWDKNHPWLIIYENVDDFIFPPMVNHSTHFLVPSPTVITTIGFFQLDRKKKWCLIFLLIFILLTDV